MVEETRWRKWKPLTIYGPIYVFLLLLGLMMSVLGVGENPWWILQIAIVMGAHFLASLKSVKEREIGVLKFWDAPIRDLERGPHFIPFPWGLTTFTRNVIQIEFGTGSDEGGRRQERSQSETYFVDNEAFRVTFGVSSKDPKDPLSQRLTFDPRVVVRFKITNGCQFLSEIGDIETAVEQIRDAAKTALQVYAGSHSPAEMLSSIGEVNKLITRRIEGIVGEKPRVLPDGREPPADTPTDSPWGIDLLSAGITSPGLPKRVNEAMADRGKAGYGAESAVVTATGEAEATRITAAAERTKREEEGAGTARAAELLAYAQAKGLKATAEVLQMPEAQLLSQLEALKEGLKSGKTVILPAELSRLTEALAGKLNPPRVVL